MRRICVAILIAGLSLGFGSTAFAADMPVKAPIYKAVDPDFGWTGCYVGASVGGGWGNDHEPAIPPEVDQGTRNPTGWLGGGQIGCDYQTGKWVIGLEGNLSWANLTGSNPIPAAPTFVWTTKVAWLSTLTARFGYTVDHSLFYVKGGAAWVHENRKIDQLGLPEWAENGTLTGWVIGGGFEYAFAPAWSVKIEYNYIDLGRRDLNVPCVNPGLCASPLSVGSRQNVQTVMLGLNYRFSPGAFVGRS